MRTAVENEVAVGSREGFPSGAGRAYRALMRNAGALLVFAFAFALMSAPALAFNDRVALVIGNDAYPGEPLKNAVNDARAMQKALQDLGFKVIFRPNADTVQMRAAAVEFTKVLDGATAAVFYYAGHGIQHREKNYLVPIDAKFSAEAEIAFVALEVGQILDYMEDAKVRYKFVILDACRNNPFRNLFQQTGLAKMTRVPPGTVISYAAQPGAVAFDGDGENGIYTKHLLKELKTPGLQSTLVFQNAGSAVGEETARKQIPEFYSTPYPGGRPFFFAERSALASSTVSGGPSADTALQAERTFWDSIKDSKRADDYQAYLEQFPTGVFARLARNRIDDLKREKSQSQVAAAPLSNAPSGAPSVLQSDAQSRASVAPSAQTSALQPAVSAPTASTAQPSIQRPQSVIQQAAPPITLASAAPVSPPTSIERGLESRVTQPAPSSPTTSPTAAPAPSPTSAPTSAPAPLAAAASATPPALPTQVAAISPSQTSALPPVPQFPKYLTGKIEFADGASYVGDYKEDKDKNQLMHGKGEFVSKVFRYKGEFRDNKKDGKGIHVWANGDQYDGDFVADEPAGRGIWEFVGGDRYEGEIAKGKFHGKGVLVTKAGDRFTGTFVEGLQQGKGVWAFANGDKYEGDMKQGKINGQGVYTSKNGDRRESSFVDGVAEGAGVYHFNNGDRYEGEFKAGALTGRGKYFYSNGLRTEGHYVNGVLVGEGMFVFNDGSWFEGVWEADGKAKGVSIAKDGKRTPAVIENGRVVAIEPK
jgi:hypothetical protein